MGKLQNHIEEEHMKCHLLSLRPLQNAIHHIDIEIKRKNWG